MLAGLLIAFVFALPNLYPDSPTLIIGQQSTMDQAQISMVLDAQNLTHKWQGENHIQFSTVDLQMRARSILTDTLPPNTDITLNLEKQTPQWLRSIGADAMKLGLDLQGGIHFLLEVDTSQIEKNAEKNLLSSISTQLKAKRIRYTDISEEDGLIKVTLLSPEKNTEVINQIAQIFPQHTITLVDGRIQLKDPTAVDQQAIHYAVEQTIGSLEKRINELGISEATIQRQGTHYISIDLPGIQDIVHAKKIIGKTATLRFHLVSNQATSLVREDESKNSLYLTPAKVLSGDSISLAHANMHDG